MKPEQRVWDNLNRKMRGYWKGDRVETSDICPGFPDVVYTCQGTTGFIELKYLARFPVQDDTIIKIDHFTRQQINFALNVQYYGGKAFMFIQVNDCIFLFNPDDMDLIFKGLTRKEFESKSYIRWFWNTFNRDEFMEVIT